MTQAGPDEALVNHLPQSKGLACICHVAKEQLLLGRCALLQ